VAASHPGSRTVVPLRRGLGDTCRDAVESTGAQFNDAGGEVDRVLSQVADHVDDTLRAARVALRAAIRAGKLTFEQERRRERVRGPVGLVAGYKPSKSE
jgi:hypothetical protein